MALLCTALTGGCSKANDTTPAPTSEVVKPSTAARPSVAAAPSAAVPSAAVPVAAVPSAAVPSAAPAVASASAASPASGAIPVSPIPAVPITPSPPPTAAEWAAGLEVNGAAEGKRARRCSMKLVREWVKIRCEGDIKEVAPDWNLWHDKKDRGKLWFEDHDYPAFGELTLRISPGFNMGAVFHRKDRTNSARFFFDWDKKKDRPTTLEVFRGTY